MSKEYYIIQQGHHFGPFMSLKSVEQELSKYLDSRSIDSSLFERFDGWETIASYTDEFNNTASVVCPDR